jgi:Zn-dependent peptidase ImmA (M78 family)
MGGSFMSVCNGLSKADEAAANKLAAYILMPADLLEQAISDVLRETGETKMGPMHLEAVAEKLKVSTTALSVRLGIPT